MKRLLYLAALSMLVTLMFAPAADSHVSTTYESVCPALPYLIGVEQHHVEGVRSPGPALVVLDSHQGRWELVRLYDLGGDLLG